MKWGMTYSAPAEANNNALIHSSMAGAAGGWKRRRQHCFKWRNISAATSADIHEATPNVTNGMSSEMSCNVCIAAEKYSACQAICRIVKAKYLVAA